MFIYVNRFDATGFFAYCLEDIKISGCLMFSGGKERDQWHEMG